MSDAPKPKPYRNMLTELDKRRVLHYEQLNEEQKMAHLLSAFLDHQKQGVELLKMIKELSVDVIAEKKAAKAEQS